jgi:rhodanese-related sulfurtransferase
MQEIDARELDRLLQQDAAPPLLLDVREDWELQICRIEGSLHIPMRQIPTALHRLDAQQPMVVICHHGIRSRQVALYLEYKGFSRVTNLRGGVAGWAQDVDPSMGTY